MTSASETEQAVPGPADPEFQGSDRSSVYFLLDTPAFASEVIRAGVSLRAGAALFNAAVHDLNSAEPLDLKKRPLKDTVPDHHKMHREIDAVALVSMEKAQ